MSSTDNTSTTKSNLIIPLALLIVSVIVIVATFYEGEHKDQIAQSDLTEEKRSETADTQLTSTEDSDTEISADITDIKQENINSDAEEVITQENKTDVVAIDNTDKQKINTVTEDKTTESATKIDTAESPLATKNVTASAETQEQNIDQLNPVPQQSKPTASASPSANNQDPVFSPYKSTRYNRKPSHEEYDARVAYAQAQARQYHEMIQQRRQSYRQEMQSRRQQHEAAMQAQHERKIKNFEAHKTVYQQAQQNRLVTNQRIQEIHDQISKLHQEIHQINNQSQPFAQMSSGDQQDTSAEKM